jgi:hypothetical protein
MKTRKWYAGFHLDKRVTRWSLQGDAIHSRLKKMAEERGWQRGTAEFRFQILPTGQKPEVVNK